MGLSFDGNGCYVGWSNLFNYDSIETLKASEFLPMPKKKVYKKTNSGVNIDSFINEIIQATTPTERILKYAKLLKYLNNNNITEVNYTAPDIVEDEDEDEDDDNNLNGNKILKKINQHEFTIIPYSLQEDANKNFISSHIQNTVQNLRNMIGAYSPIEMEDFRAASEYSPKGESASQMTLLNPTTKLLMQYQNITGKNVIGIAANGEKASFMWHYYINDVIQTLNRESLYYQKLFTNKIDEINQTSGKNYDYINIVKYIMDDSYREEVLKNYDDTIKESLKDLDKYINLAKTALFSFKTNRIKGRFQGMPVNQEINTLPDVNFEGVNPELVAYFGNRLTGDITVDLMISQVLSAATDNAKELILAKVNAGNKLAKMYLFLITLGFDITDIVKFMTSPAISFIDTITESNIFTGQDINITTAVKLARGNFNNFYKNFMSNTTIGKLSVQDRNKLNTGQVENITNNFTEGTTEYIELNNAIESILELKQLKDSYIQTELEERKKNNKDLSDKQITEQILNEFILDIDEFENVMEGANEFSNLGRLLGINQGLPTAKSELQDKLQFIQNILQTRVDENNEVNIEPLDVNKYFKDLEYAQEIRDAYNKVKKCSNVFDIVDRIPQFKAIFDIFSAVMDIDHNISLKTRIYDTVYKQLKDEKTYMTEEYQARLLKGIDEFIIARFINQSGIQIPYKSGTTILNNLRQAVTASEDGLLRFNSLGDVASFKYLFENTIIPALKEGIIYDYQDGQVVKVQNSTLSSNKFIQSLIKGDNKGIPLYKCNLDMMTIDNSPLSKIKFQNYVKGLQELQKIKINNNSISLADLFVLYNLIVNKDQYGSDRMTTLFDTMVQSKNELSLINKYFKFVGDLDYNAKVSTSNGIQVEYDGKSFGISVQDLMIRAAAIVNTAIGQKDPVIIVNTESGPELRKKVGYTYDKWREIIPKISGETKDEYLTRLYYHNSYFVLGGSYQDLIESQIKSLRNMDDNALATIKQLMQQGVLYITRVCQ